MIDSHYFLQLVRIFGFIKHGLVFMPGLWFGIVTLRQDLYVKNMIRPAIILGRSFIFFPARE